MFIKSLCLKMRKRLDMAENTQDLTIDYSPQGIIGKSETLRILQKRFARKEAVHAVHEKNALPGLFHALEKAITTHEINAAREKQAEILREVFDGLQNTHHAKTRLMILAKEHLLEKLTFYQKHGSELSFEQIKSDREFLDNLRTTVNQIFEYVNGIQRATKGEITPLFGKIDREVEKYEARMFFSFLKPMFEWFSERSAVRAAYKVERKIIGIEGKRTLTGSDIHEMLKLDKEFSYDFKRVITDLYIFSFIFVKYGRKSAELVRKAVAEINLPKSHESEFSGKIYKLFESVRGSLQSEEKSVNYLFDLLGKTLKHIENAEANAKKMKVAVA